MDISTETCWGDKKNTTPNIPNWVNFSVQKTTKRKQGVPWLGLQSGMRGKTGNSSGGRSDFPGTVCSRCGGKAEGEDARTSRGKVDRKHSPNSRRCMGFRPPNCGPCRPSRRPFYAPEKYNRLCEKQYFIRWSATHNKHTFDRTRYVLPWLETTSAHGNAPLYTVVKRALLSIVIAFRK